MSVLLDYSSSVLTPTFTPTGIYNVLQHFHPCLKFKSLTDEDAARYSRELAHPLPSYGDPDEPTQWEFHVF